MPPIPKSSPKKSGTPKTRGGNRAKSGCYTCRIRRKKCDEIKNANLQCETCVRLKLECLGFGSKRPEYLRDNRNVAAMLEKIKTFLGSHGMIKGHAATGSRNSDQDYLRLRVVDDYSSDSSTSPPTPTLTIPEDTFSQPVVSAVRGERWFPDTNPPTQEWGPDSPYGSPPVQPYSDVFPVPLTPSSNSIVPTSWQHDLFRSSLPESYSMMFFDEELLDTTPQQYMNFPQTFSPRRQDDDLIQYYGQKVVELQYLLVDTAMQRTLFITTNSDNDLRNAVCLLSRVHQLSNNKLSDLSNEVGRRFSTIDHILKKTTHTANHAMAALHTVSTFLFVGGDGEWWRWLNVAHTFCTYQLSLYRSPAEMLLSCDEQLRFILKTTMWFDVIASVTRCEPPLFMEQFRSLFSPDTAFIDNPLAPLDPRLSMLDVMGCENRVVWAMAEVSELAYWKDSCQRMGRPSTPQLYERGRKIEKHLLPRMGPEEVYDNNLKLQRQYTSEIFRSSTRVYLHSILSGGYPECPEIKEGVRETILHLQRVPHTVPQMQMHGASRSVVRSVVLSIFLCGCLTDDQGQRDYLKSRLIEQDNQEAVGNCAAVKRLMEDIWLKREKRGNTEDPVPWREELNKSGLLLV